MSEWRMSWRDPSEDPLLPFAAWTPQSVTSEAVRVVLVAIRGFNDLPAEPVLVAWDNECETVRLANGELQWWFSGTRQAYPRKGEILIEDATAHPFPRGNRYMEALLVRSLEDLLETVNADEITSIDENGTIHIYGGQDNSRGQVVRSGDTGIILRASGVQGTSPWDSEVLATRLIEGDRGLLEPADVTPSPM